MKNVILLAAVLFALSQAQIVVDVDQALFVDGLYIVMGAEPNVNKLVGLHLSVVPFTISVMAVITVLFAYLMEYIEKK